jgi:predicted DNA binding CopG/RHH family protein
MSTAGDDMEKRKSKRGNYEIEDLGDIELSPELDEKIQRMTEAADAELEATRVNFRWQREPLSLIKEVAAAMGIPYQTYIKQVLYRQALEDLAKIKSNRASSQSIAAPAPRPPRQRKKA